MLTMPYIRKSNPQVIWIRLTFVLLRGHVSCSSYQIQTENHQLSGTCENNTIVLINKQFTDSGNTSKWNGLMCQQICIQNKPYMIYSSNVIVIKA